MEKLLDDAFWWLDDHLDTINGINLAIGIINLLVRNHTLITISMMLLIPVWLTLVIMYIYGMKKGYFIW